ncbi:MAG: type VI secretion system tube protein Hcp [Gammaproteobacteria bacterium]
MAMQMFLTVDGIDGESKKEGMEDTIDILSCSFGIHRPSTSHSGSGGSGGDLSAGDLIVMKNLDAASNGIRESIVTGTQDIPMTLTVRKPTKDKVETLVYEMEGCMFTGVEVNVDDSSDVVQEMVSLAYNKVTFKHTPEQNDGSAGGEMSCVLNIETSAVE